jgi:hypothetical protein
LVPLSRRGRSFGLIGAERCEDAQAVISGGPWLGGQDHQALAGTVGAVPDVTVEGEVADDRVPVVLGP